MLGSNTRSQLRVLFCYSPDVAVERGHSNRLEEGVQMNADDQNESRPFTFIFPLQRHESFSSSFQCGIVLFSRLAPARKKRNHTTRTLEPFTTRCVPKSMYMYEKQYNLAVFVLFLCSIFPVVCVYLL